MVLFMVVLVSLLSLCQTVGVGTVQFQRFLEYQSVWGGCNQFCSTAESIDSG